MLPFEIPSRNTIHEVLAEITEMPSAPPITVAIVGIGNCASSFIQGLNYYRHASADRPAPRLMHPEFAGYLISDIRVVAAFDVNANKVGKSISEAICTPPNNARVFADVPRSDTTVHAGFIGDSIASHISSSFALSEAPDNVVPLLRSSGAQMCISFLPVGSTLATRFYAEACLKAGLAFINGIPESIASDPKWADRFARAGLACAGDDVQSQIGATVLHRAILDLILERGHGVSNSYQLDIGGNEYFHNMVDRTRLSSKLRSKTDVLIHESACRDIVVSPAEFVPFLGDNKVAYINIQGRQFGDIPFSVEVRLSVDDSPNNAGVMVDVVRAMRVSIDQGRTGYQPWSAYYFKRPLNFIPLEAARDLVLAMARQKPKLSG